VVLAHYSQDLLRLLFQGSAIPRDRIRVRFKPGFWEQQMMGTAHPNPQVLFSYFLPKSLPISSIPAAWWLEDRKASAGKSFIPAILKRSYFRDPP